VERLHDALKDRGHEVWVDFEDIPPSAEWFEEIRAGLLAADGVVFVISPDSVASAVCRRELDEAVAQHKRIVPAVHRDPGSAPVPESAAALNWVFLRERDDFDAGLDTLVSALETDLDHVHTHTRLGIAAERWQDGGRDRSRLLRGAELAAGEAWLVGAGGKEPQPTQLQREYLLASRQAATRRQRAIIGAVSLALLVAIGLGVLALVQRNDAVNNLHEAQAALEDTEALSNYATDPQLSVREAVDAVGIIASPQTTQRLREALAQAHLRAVFNPPGGDEPDALWNSAGTRLLVTSPAVSARIVSPGTNAPPINLPAPQVSGDVAWDGDGDRVVVGGAHPAVYSAKTGRLIARLPGAALKVALSSDGSLVATSDLDGVGHVYVVATGAQLSSFTPAYRGGVTCFAWSPDDSVIAQCDARSLTADTPASLDLWDPHTGRLLHSDHSDYLIGTVSFSPDSSLYAYTTTNAPPKEPTLAAQLHADVVASGAPGTFVYDTQTGGLLKTFPNGATAATFSPTTLAGTELGYANSDGVGYVYNFTSKRNLPLEGATAGINSISFSAAGAYVVTASDDGTARVYDASTGSLLETLADGDVGPVYGASFGLGDAEIATASTDGRVRLWSSPESQPAATKALPGRPAFPSTVAFMNNGGRIVETGELGGGELIDERNLRLVAGFTAPVGYGYAGALASHDGRLVAALAYRISGQRFVGDGLVQTFNGRTGKLLTTIEPPAGVVIDRLAMDATGGHLVTLYSNGDAQQWNPRTGARAQLLSGSQPALLAVYSPDGATLAIAHTPSPPPALSYDTHLGPVTIDLWDTRDGRLERRLTGPDLEPLTQGVERFGTLALAFSPDGNEIALTGADRYVYRFATASASPNQRLAVPDGEFASSVAFSPDSQLLAIGTAAGAYVRESGAWLPVFQHADRSEFDYEDGGGVDVGFAGDSSILVTVGDQEIRAWEIADQLPLFGSFIGKYGHGTLDPAGTELVTGDGHTLSVYRCDLCGGLSSLLATARRIPKD
jgi:WD40 repeat protein